jgi:hypothetical protein
VLNPLRGHAGERLVSFGVEPLEVAEQQADPGQESRQDWPRRIAARVQGRVQALRTAALGQLGHKLGLHQRFAARKRDASSRLGIEGRVSLDHAHHLLGVALLAADAQGAVPAGRHAPPRLPQRLWPRKNGFRVVAPDAGERTPLEKHHGPDARAIKRRTSLDVADQAFTCPPATRVATALRSSSADYGTASPRRPWPRVVYDGEY